MMLLRILSWPYLRRHLLRWTLTLTGIVLGVAVFRRATASVTTDLFNGRNML